MKKSGFMLVLAALLLVMSLQFAAAVPAWKKQPAAASEPQVIYINQTVPAQDSGGLNWEMIGVIIAVVGVGVGWLISRKVRGKTAKYMGEVDKVYRTYNKNANKCEAELAGLKEKIESDFKKGKINDQSLAILGARIDKYSEKLRTDIIDKGFKLPPGLDKKIKHMLSDGIITKEEYNHFLEIIKEDHGMGKADEARLRALMKKWKTEDRR